jgi:hypothetical protein
MMSSYPFAGRQLQSPAPLCCASADGLRRSYPPTLQPVPLTHPVVQGAWLLTCHSVSFVCLREWAGLENIGERCWAAWSRMCCTDLCATLGGGWMWALWLPALLGGVDAHVLY